MSDTPRTDAEEQSVNGLGALAWGVRAWNLASTLERELAAKSAEVERLREALRDMLDGWKYIRGSHGDLYGVGWDRAQDKAEAALQEPTK